MSNYRGRFAPSPTGPLHFGSLFAAVISFLHARAHNGQWLVRIEDLDPPREQAHAKQAILKTLKAHGLEWDEPVVYQSERSAFYEARLAQLAEQGLSYSCPCSRKQLAERDGEHTEACQKKQFENLACAVKFKSRGEVFSWSDGFQGREQLALSDDFVLKRKDGLYAYQLAVVCDDIEQKISHVVRGYDLLDSTPMQLALYHALGHQAPELSHFPVIVSQSHQKLSKQNLAPAVDDDKALQNLNEVFRSMQLSLSRAPVSVAEAIELGIAAWKLQSPSALNRKEIIQSF